MPHSLRVKIKGLQYKKIITDRDCDRLCKALDTEKVLEQIRDEIKQTAIDFDEYEDYRRVRGLWIALEVIDKYR